MKILVSEMPKKKEECLFYRKKMLESNGSIGVLYSDCCALNNKKCSLKNNDSFFGAECRCLRVSNSFF